MSITNKKLKKAFPLLKVLSKLPDQDRTTLIEYLNGDATNALCECVHNAINNRQISGRHQLCSKALRSKDDLRYISKNHTKSKQKHKLKKLIQVGGSPIGLILSAVLPLLASALFKKK
jgi:hypothetical protein